MQSKFANNNLDVIPTGFQVSISNEEDRLLDEERILKTHPSKSSFPSKSISLHAASPIVQSPIEAHLKSFLLALDSTKPTICKNQSDSKPVQTRTIFRMFNTRCRLPFVNVDLSDQSPRQVSVKANTFVHIPDALPCANWNSTATIIQCNVEDQPPNELSTTTPI